MKKLLAMAAVSVALLVETLASGTAAEMRGLWVDAFHPGLKTPEETARMVRKAKDCNFNALFVQVRRRGDVYYNSRIEPMARDAVPGYDPLADVVAKAHAAGLEVHAWISVYETYHDTVWNTSDARQVHLKHPEWLMKNSRGRVEFPGDKIYLDPGVPEVRTYLVGIVEEIMAKYMVDGIHLDTVRYPAPDGGYNDSSIASFNRETGRSGKPDLNDEVWSSWRRAQVALFVRAAYQAVKSSRPSARLSASVFASKADAYGCRFQDWEGWLEAGILDFAVPMVFPKDNRVFKASMADVVGSGHGRLVYLGQGGYRMNAADAVEQISLARQAGFQGVVVYSYSYCSRPGAKGTVSLMDLLKSGLFAKPDTVPAMTWK